MKQKQNVVKKCSFYTEHLVLIDIHSKAGRFKFCMLKCMRCEDYALTRFYKVEMEISVIL